MPQKESTPVLSLYRSWRAGDAPAGQEMAQRFSDWYYAISVCHLGDQEGREPLEQACERFAAEIANVRSSGQLMDWSHAIIKEEIQRSGSRSPGGDFPSNLTNGRSPAAILASVGDALTDEQIRLLEHNYDETYPRGLLKAEADRAGGFPISILQARYALKRWLRNSQGIPFQVTPARINPDFAPLPLYESGRLGSHEETTRFERWMINHASLCHDIAEFAPFSLAIRGGALSGSGAAGALARGDRPRASSDHRSPVVFIVLVLAVLLALAFLLYYTTNIFAK